MQQKSRSADPKKLEIPTQEIVLDGNIRLFVRREDLIHPTIPGNKYRKLKYNLAAAKASELPILTFGGAHSNHIAAVASAGNLYQIDTIGVIRGEELAAKPLNNTLETARSNGMRLHFINRVDYRQKNTESFLALLQQRFGPFFYLPEGGTNEAAVKGCEEILTDGDFRFDYICCACGTGGTVAGIARRAKPGQQVLAFAAARDPQVGQVIEGYTSLRNWRIVPDYDFGGYGKVDRKLVDFLNGFYREHAIMLDPVYTGKMMFGVMDMINNGKFRPGSSILVIHTGGIQGIKGMNEKLTKSNMPIIEYI